MNKYLLAGLCLLAFVAGGVAQLALRHARGTEVKVKRAVESSMIAVPEVRAQTAETPAQPTNSPDTPDAEAQDAQAEMPVVTTDGAGGEETVGEPVGTAAHARRAPSGMTRKVRYRAAGGRRATARHTVAVNPNKTAADTRGRMVQQTAGGAKRSGSWLGRKLKKIGDVFHE